jgi:hypothetical protein
MKKFIYIVIISTTLISCNKKQVKVPLVAMQGEEEVANNSVIWFFYDKNGNLSLNEKNRISSTNWFFNVDKRLPLKKIMPEVIRLFNKHNEKSPHNTKPMKNYFTYVNTLNNHLSFYSFDSIRYFIIKKNQLPKFIKDTLILKITNENFKTPYYTDSTKVIQPVFSEKMTFQEYLTAKSKLKKIFQKQTISLNEYIITELNK